MVIHHSGDVQDAVSGGLVGEVGGVDLDPPLPTKAAEVVAYLTGSGLWASRLYGEDPRRPMAATLLAEWHGGEFSDVLFVMTDREAFALRVPRYPGNEDPYRPEVVARVFRGAAGDVLRAVKDWPEPVNDPDRFQCLTPPSIPPVFDGPYLGDVHPQYAKREIPKRTA